VYHFETITVSSGNRAFTIWIEWPATWRMKASEADLFAVAVGAP
jgi:hypothetical protein